jgi:hypothetical protein
MVWIRDQEKNLSRIPVQDLLVKNKALDLGSLIGNTVAFL